MDLQSLGSVKPLEPVWEADVTCRRVEENIAYEEYPAVVGPVRLDTGRRTAGEGGLPDKWKAIVLTRKSSWAEELSRGQETRC